MLLGDPHEGRRRERPLKMRPVSRVSPFVLGPAARLGLAQRALIRLRRSKVYEEIAGHPVALILAVIGVTAAVVPLLWLRSAAAGSPALSMEVKVRQADGADWRDFEGAPPGSLLEYKAIIRDIGDGPIHDMDVIFDFPDTIHLFASSCRYGEGGAFSPCPAGVATGELRLPPPQGSEALTIVIRAQLLRDVGRRGQLGQISVNSDETDPTNDRVDVLPRASYVQAAVWEFFRHELATNPLLGQRPQMSRSARRAMRRHWPELDPGRSHAFDSVPLGSPTSIRRLDSDRRLDGKIVHLRAIVRTEPIEYDATRQHRWRLPTIRRVRQVFEISASRRGQRAWCVTTRLAGHLLRRGVHLAVRATPITWLRSKHFGASTVMLDCAGVRLDSG
jgi:hypothetical protein